jgi:KDO2-lipid IV(A) lauroyltransferase
MANLRRCKSDLGWMFIRLLLAGVRRLDLSVVIRLGRSLGWASSYLFTFRKSVALLNLRVALRDRLSSTQRRKIFRTALGNAATMALETLRYCFGPPQTFISNVRISGLKHLATAASAGRGVILAGGHVGNFTLVAARLTRAGFPTWVILRIAHDPRVARLYRDMTHRLAVNWISDKPRSRCVRESLLHLKAGHVLHILIDQKPSPGTGCLVPFFGIPTEMFPGAVTMALKTGAPVLPVTIHRTGLTTHLIEILPPIQMVRSPNRLNDVELSLTRVVQTFEDAIRKYPEEWWVISRRWTPRQVAAAP